MSLEGHEQGSVNEQAGGRQRVTEWIRERQRDQERQAKKKEAIKREGERQNRPRATYTERRKEKGKS